MSHFFSRLIERAHAPTPVVHPLIVANFAPTNLWREETATTDAPAYIASTPSVFPSVSQVSPDALTVDEQRPAHINSTPMAFSPASLVSPDALTTDERQPARAIPQPHTTRAPNVPATPRVACESVLPPQASPDTVPPHVLCEPRLPSPIAPTSREHSQDVEPTFVEYSVALRIEPTHANDDLAPMIASRDGTALPRARPLTRAATRAAQANTPAILPRSAIAPAPTQESGTPTIHVKIGRIEVRAISAPPPPTPVVKPKPGLSLENYLRARDEGTR